MKPFTSAFFGAVYCCFFIIGYQNVYSAEEECTFTDKIARTTLHLPAESTDINSSSVGTTGNNGSEGRMVEVHKLAESEEKEEKEEIIETEEKTKSIPAPTANNLIDLTYSIDTPTVRHIWKGLNIFSAADCLNMKPINPPDVTMGVSKNYVAQMVHNSIEVWDKDGVPIIKQSLHDFFNISRDHYMTDPVMIYDKSIGAWFAAIVDGGIENRTENGLSYWSCIPTCKIVLGKSHNDNPTKNRTLIDILPAQEAFFPDEPKISVSKFNVFITATEFNVTSPDQNFFVAYMIDKPFKDFRRDPWSNRVLILPYKNQHFVVPEKEHSSCSTTVALVKDDPTEKYSNASSIQILDFCDKNYISYLGPIEVKLPEKSKLVPALNLRALITETDLKISSALRDGKSLWIALQAACHPTMISNYSCVRVLKLDNVTTEEDYDYSLVNDTQVYLSGTNQYFPAIAISNEKKLFLISGFSNSSIFPSLSFSQILSENRTLNLQNVFGSYINNSTRYGDYFGSALDPVDGSVWFSGQYVDGSILLPIPPDFADIPRIREQSWSTIIANLS